MRRSAPHLHDAARSLVLRLLRDLPGGRVTIIENGCTSEQRVTTGPLRSIRLVNLKPRQRAELSAAGEEHTLFTLGGSGEISSGEGAVPLKYGVSVTLPLGTGMTVTAGDAGLEYFLASLEVPGGGAR